MKKMFFITPMLITTEPWPFFAFIIGALLFLAFTRFVIAEPPYKEMIFTIRSIEMKNGKTCRVNTQCLSVRHYYKDDHWEGEYEGQPRFTLDSQLIEKVKDSFEPRNDDDQDVHPEISFE